MDIEKEVLKIRAQLEKELPLLLEKHLKGIEYNTDVVRELREKITLESIDRINALTRGIKGTFVHMVHVMIFEQCSFDRGINTLLRKTDMATVAEYRGEEVYGVIDLVVLRV